MHKNDLRNLQSQIVEKNLTKLTIFEVYVINYKTQEREK